MRLLLLRLLLLVLLRLGVGVRTNRGARATVILTALTPARP